MINTIIHPHGYSGDVVRGYTHAIQKYCLSFDRTIDEKTYIRLKGVDLPALQMAPINRTDKRPKRPAIPWFSEESDLTPPNFLDRLNDSFARAAEVRQLES